MKFHLVLLAGLLSVGGTVLAAENSERLKAALEAEPSCQRFVRFDDRNLYLGFGYYRSGTETQRSPIPGRLRVVPIDRSGSFELATKDAAIDVVTDQGSAFVLTFSSLEEWDLAKRQRVAEYPTYAKTSAMANMEHAQAMARYQDKLIIAHGRLGVAIFDLKKRRLVNQFRLLKSQLPHESMATGVTVQGTRAYIVMDNYHVARPEDGVALFRGIIVVDMERETVEAELGGMDPGANAIVSDANKVIVSFDGIPVWKYRLSSLQGTRIPEPELRIWKYGVPGTPTGSPAIDDQYYYTCFDKGGPGERHQRVPMALSRASLKLD